MDMSYSVHVLYACIIDTVAKLDTQSSTVSHYSGGEAVGGSWTDKVMSVKQAGSQSLPQDQNEGVDDDEWVRFYMSVNFITIFSLLPAVR